MRTGQSVSTLQYMIKRWPSGRRRRTAKMRFSASSMVSMSITAVTTRKARPIAVSRPACSESPSSCSVRFSSPCASGRKFSNRNSCSVVIASSNTGNAVAAASATVSSGTMERRVVKVRLPASWKQRSSSKRRHADFATSRTEAGRSIASL